MTESDEQVAAAVRVGPVPGDVVKVAEFVPKWIVMDGEDGQGSVDGLAVGSANTEVCVVAVAVAAALATKVSDDRQPCSCV